MVKIFLSNITIEFRLIKFQEKGTLKISTNTSNDITNSLNESSLIFGVINNLILLIANDMGVEAQFDSHSNKSSSADIAINVNEGIRKAVSKASLKFFRIFQMPISPRCGHFIRIGTVSSTRIQRNSHFIDHL